MDQQDPQNDTTSAPPPPSAANPEHQSAMWAHLGGGILALVCVLSFFSWAPPLIIYMTQKDKSRFVAFHSLQALILFGVVAAINFPLFLLGMVGLFILTTPLALLINVGAFVYALITALKANRGEWAEYVLIGEFVRGKHGPQGG